MRYARATDDFYVPGGRGRAHAGRQAGRVLVRAGRSPSSPRRRASELQAVYEAAYRDLRGAGRAGRRARARALRAARRRLHRVLLDGQRARADELRLAAQRRDGPARDPPLRRGRRAVPRASACRSRTPPSSRTTARRPRPGCVVSTDRVRAAARSLARDDPAVEAARGCTARSAGPSSAARATRKVPQVAAGLPVSRQEQLVVAGPSAAPSGRGR